MMGLWLTVPLQCDGGGGVHSTDGSTAEKLLSVGVLGGVRVFAVFEKILPRHKSLERGGKRARGRGRERGREREGVRDAHRRGREKPLHGPCCRRGSYLGEQWEADGLAGCGRQVGGKVSRNSLLSTCLTPHPPSCRGL